MNKYCKNCGTQLKTDVKYCLSCGKLTTAPEQYVNAKAQSYKDDLNPNISKRGKKQSKKIFIPVIAAVLLVAIGIGLFMFLSSGGSYPFEKGATVEQNIPADKSITVGSSDKTGWQLEIPDNTFAEDSKLIMKVLSETEAQSYTNNDFVIFGTPVEIKQDDKDNVRLGSPVTLSLQIPKKYLENLTAEELFFATYYDRQWEYFTPDNVDLDKGMATVEIHHFSLFCFGRPSEEDQIKTYAKNYASLQWESEKQTTKLTDSLSRQYDDLFASIGVNDSSLRTQLTLDVINYLESEKLETGDMAPISTLANMANSISQGQAGMDDFRGQLIEFTGKALYRTLEKDPGKFSSLANVTGGLSTAAGAISEGDTEGALKGIANVLRGANPIVAVADTALTCVKESMEYGIELWTQNEIEKAYQIYIGNASGKYGYESGLEGDFDTIFTTLGGGERMMKINIIKKHCAKYGVKESTLSQADRDRIISNAMIYLKRSFDERKVSDAEIKKMQESEEAFIAELKKQNLLGASSYQKYFGIEKNLRNFSIGDRLARLYKLKATVLGVMDKEVAEKISAEELAKAINQWIYWNEAGDRQGFFDYMREMGYIKDPYKVDPSYAWVLVETLDFEYPERWATSDAHIAYAVSYSYSRGSYSASITYEGDDPYDQGLSGTFSSKAVFSGIPEIIYPDKPVTLNLSFSTTENSVVKLSFGSSAGADFDEWDLGPGAATHSRLSFANKDEETSFNLDVNGNPTSYNEKLTATIGAGSEGSRIALRTKFYMGVSMGTNYVYEWKQVN